MRKLFKQVIALSMASVMTIGTAGVVSARVANNTNVAGNVTWTGFSVLRDDPKWAAADETCKTEGYLTGTQSASSFNMYVKNSGWDANWNAYVDPPTITSDNPWGLTVTASDIPVEAGRSYTISYKIKSTLSVTDATTKETITDKYIQCKVYTKDMGDPAVDLDTASGCDKSGYMTLKKDQEKTVTATFTVKSDYTKGSVGVKFALGAFLKSYPEQKGMSGYVTVTDFKITANPQYSVTFKSGSTTLKTSWVNNNSKVASYTPKKAGYTFVGWYADGKPYSFSTKVTKNIVLTAKWQKTTAPARAKITKLKSNRSKRLTVTIKNISAAKGYQIQYSTTKNFKSKKSKYTTKRSYTITKLKSGVKYYVRVKAYKLDSTGKKVLSKKWSVVKGAYVR